MDAVQFVKEKGIAAAILIVEKYADEKLHSTFKYWSPEDKDFTLKNDPKHVKVEDLKILVDKYYKNRQNLNEREILKLIAHHLGFTVKKNAVNISRENLNPNDHHLWLDHKDALFHTGWNPIDNDADAFQLAVRMQLIIHNEHVRTSQVYCGRVIDNSGTEEYFQAVTSDGDEEITAFDMKNTRKAIFLAAKEIVLRGINQ